MSNLSKILTKKEVKKLVGEGKARYFRFGYDEKFFVVIGKDYYKLHGAYPDSYLFFSDRIQNPRVRTE